MKEPEGPPAPPIPEGAPNPPAPQDPTAPQPLQALHQLILHMIPLN